MKNKLKFITKTFLIKTFAVLMIMGMMDSLAFSQTRIRFARGENSTHVGGKLNGGESRSYIVGGRRGQMMTFSIISSEDMWVDVGDTEFDTGDTIELPSTADYIITVHNDDDITANYSLYVNIQ